jgi:hypothetical protein
MLRWRRRPLKLHSDANRRGASRRRSSVRYAAEGQQLRSGAGSCIKLCLTNVATVINTLKGVNQRRSGAPSEIEHNALT